MAEQEVIVFVVEDDPPNRDALERLIRSVRYPVQTSGSAEEFLRGKRPDAPAYLLLDVRLPGLNGLEFQRALVEAPEHSALLCLSLPMRHAPEIPCGRTSVILPMTPPRSSATQLDSGAEAGEPSD